MTTTPMKEVLALIPARSGSKGLPNKNIRPLLGHPLIAYSIKAALGSPTITRTIVSTDSEQIALEAKKYGAEVPFIRPKKYATDHSTDFEVFKHALDLLKHREEYNPDLIIQLRPTSPVRFPEYIEESIDLLMNSTADSLRTITLAPVTPYKMWILGEDRSIQPLLNSRGIKEPYNQPRQKLPPIYWQTGTLDVIKTDTIAKKKSMSGRDILSLIIPNHFAIDIDDYDSFQQAECIISQADCIKF
jgi:CMP-N,N'-diacetyllegionaminic acid synthase